MERIDLDAMRQRVAEIPLIHDTVTRREGIASLSLLALIDIAASLRVVADEAAAAMLETKEPEPEPEPGGLQIIPPSDVEIGDRAGGDDAVGIVREAGDSEGRRWVRVSWFPDVHSDETYDDILEHVSEKTWADTLTFDRFEWGDDLYAALARATDKPIADAVVEDLEKLDDDDDEDADDLEAFTPPPAAPTKKKGKGKK
jgi:hypothetical protein